MEEVEADADGVFETAITTLDHLDLEGIQPIVVDSGEAGIKGWRRSRRWGESGCVRRGRRSNRGGTCATV